jgi:hypothetical protein
MGSDFDLKSFANEQEHGLIKFQVEFDNEQKVTLYWK